MREKGSPASLNELMGKGGEESESFELEDLKELLGEKMPELPYNKIGRQRLLNALQVRFGPGFQNLPGIKKILSQFDNEISTASVISRNKERE